MMEIAACHRVALEFTGTLVAGVKEQQWTSPTPDEGWDVRALVDHLVSGNLWVAELAGERTIEDVGDRLDGDLLGMDPSAAYTASAHAAADAFDAPGALDSPWRVSYGPVPGSVYAGHRLIEVLIHGWDLAVATGQDTGLDEDLVQACLNVVEPQIDLLAASGFGAPIEVPVDADPQTRLLAMLGRKHTPH